LVLEPVRFGLRWWVNRAATPTEHATTAPSNDEKPALNRRIFLARAGAVAAGAASAALVGVGTATAVGPPDLLRVPVRLRRLDAAFNGFRIAVVSDIHLGPLAGRAHTERIVRMINESEPDLVGDRRRSRRRDGGRTRLRRGAVAGLALSRRDVLCDRQSRVLRRGSDVVAARTRATRCAAVAQREHSVDQAAARGVDLQLSGHTHGGQMWPFHYIVRAVQPTLAGLSAAGDSQLYVTRGAGFWGPPVRVGARPDITVVTLQPGHPSR
jgi:hypothetical protein